jgi:hypothetical protein
VSDGTERSGTGRFINVIAAAPQSSDSLSNPSSVDCFLRQHGDENTNPLARQGTDFVAKAIAAARASNNCDPIRSRPF